MNMTLIEMDGFLRGKCLPGDMKVNETNAEYLLRKMNELQQKLTESDRYGRQADITIENLERRMEQLAAENAALKAGSGFFTFSEETGFESHKTKAEAIASAEDMIAVCREEAVSDGWPEGADSICWGVIVQKAVEGQFEKPSEANGWIGWSEYSLVPSIETPATEAILAEVRASAIAEYANKRGFSYQHGSIHAHFGKGDVMVGSVTFANGDSGINFAPVREKTGGVGTDYEWTKGKSVEQVDSVFVIASSNAEGLEVIRDKLSYAIEELRHGAAK